jgi:uncharacterized protein (DUF1499 family)
LRKEGKVEKSAALVLCVSFLLFRCTGTRPGNLGVTNGKLAPCPRTPNCVSSQSTDSFHYIDPLVFSGRAADARDRLLRAINGMKRVVVVKSEDRYVYAEFTSAVFRFVDDVEFHFDEAAGKIHVRSASRLGRSDMGVNRARVEEIRKRFAAIDKSP